jgi:DNA-binding XRE family transcriptional regulator
MALHRDGGLWRRELKPTSASVPDIGRSLRLAREHADLTIEEAARRAGLARSEVEALESGTVSRMRDRVETLRSLRTYADSLGLPGHDFVLAVVELWPSLDHVPTRPVDSGQVPVVSLSAAPVGGHSPAGDGRTGAADFSISGVVSPLVTASIYDTGPIPILETGEIPAVKQAPPRWLRGLVAAAAVLVVLGIFTLTEHSQFSPWARSVHHNADHWVHNAEVAAGLSPKPAPAHREASKKSAGAKPKVVMVQSPSASAVTANVHASHFVVVLAAVQYSSWFQVTDTTHQRPIFEQVLPAGGAQDFTVTRSITVETGSGSARAYIYEGHTIIGAVTPPKAPYTITFNAVG